MSYYNSPAEMFDARAKRYRDDGNRHWAMAKNGCGDHHYGKAKTCYEQAAANTAKAEQARATGATFRKSGSR